jgi:acyl dehydratase
MAVDRGVIGRVEPEHSVEVERGGLRLFAKVIGETRPIYTDVDVAKNAGHRDLPVPPTFLFCLNMARPSTLYADLGVDPRTVLHGEQSFTYRAMAYAGDDLTFATVITDVYTKKGGALQFIVRATSVTRGEEPIAELASTIVVREISE